MRGVGCVAVLVAHLPRHECRGDRHLLRQCGGLERRLEHAAEAALVTRAALLSHAAPHARRRGDLPRRRSAVARRTARTSRTGRAIHAIRAGRASGGAGGGGAAATRGATRVGPGRSGRRGQAGGAARPLVMSGRRGRRHKPRSGGGGGCGGARRGERAQQCCRFVVLCLRRTLILLRHLYRRGPWRGWRLGLGWCVALALLRRRCRRARRVAPRRGEQPVKIGERRRGRRRAADQPRL